MPKTALEELETRYAEVIKRLPGQTFDSHQFILALAQLEQRTYVRALAEYAETGRPFQIVHGEIARRLQNYPELAQKIGEQNSADIFGQVNSAAVWRKVS